MIRFAAIVFFLLPFLAFGQKIINLRCNDDVNPLGIDDTKPRLSWNIASTRIGERQTGYEVLVSSSKELLANNIGDLWDSRRVLSEHSIYIPYLGIALKSREKCYWKVRIWNRDAKVSAWSDAAFWSMGLLQLHDWKASWITASQWFTPKQYRPKGLEIGPSGGWADVDLGASMLISKINLFPFHAGLFPLRFRIESSDEMLFHHPKVLIDYFSKDYQLKDTGVQQFLLNNIKARFVRLHIKGDPSKKADFVVRQMQVFSGGKNVALMKFTREYGTYWSRGHAVFLIDGMPSANDGDTCPNVACPTTTAPLFRKSFLVTKPIKQATLYIAALGMVDVFINGKKAGNEELGPPFTDYYKRIIYLTKDITSLLQNGENTIGAVLGNGYFSPPGLGFGKRHSGNGPPRLILQAEIKFIDGSYKTINTNGSWKWAKSEIVKNDLWSDYQEDRLQVKSGWDMPGHKDTLWQNVSVTRPLPGKLCAHTGPPIRINGVLKPVEVKNNIARFDVLTGGWPQVKVNGKAGQTIVITGSSPGLKLPELSFTLAVDGPAVLQPKFLIFAGASEIKITGVLEPLTTDDISILQVNADVSVAGSFQCSNPYLNNLFEVTMRTHRNYLYDFPADPSREKQGWTQDAQNMFNTAAWFTDVKGFYQKWWWDMADNQDSQGYTGSVVPVVNRQVTDWNSPWWSGVLVFLPWEHYKYYGDKRILEAAFEPMQHYVDFLSKMAATGEGKNWNAYPYFTNDLDTAAAKEKMIIWNGAGDWQNPYTTGQFAVPAPMTTMPAYYYYATIVSKTAALLNKKEEVIRYEKLATDIKIRFNKRYFNPETGWYGDSTNNQTAQVLPLALGLVPEGKQDMVYKRLLDAIDARDGHIGTGFVASPFLMQTLAKQHASEVANKMVNQKDYPGWNTLIKNGVLMETWRGIGAQMPSCGGSVGSWLFESVLGIQPDIEWPGFKKFNLAPQPDLKMGLTYAKGSYDCVYGRIVSDWKYENNEFKLHAVIPVNTAATIYLPVKNASDITVSGLALIRSTGVKLLKIENGVAMLSVESGEYYLSSKNLQL